MLIVLGAVAIVMLMVSCATAVPTTNSKPTMDYVEKIETLKDKSGQLKEALSGPFLDWIQRIIEFIIRMISGTITTVTTLIKAFGVWLKTTLGVIPGTIIAVIHMILAIINGAFNPPELI